MARRFWFEDSEFDWKEHIPIVVPYWDYEKNEWLERETRPGDFDWEYWIQFVFEEWCEDNALGVSHDSGEV